MTDFLLELRSEEIPARMQVKAKDDLARLFAEEIGKAGLTADAIETFATPRRLALIARGLPEATEAVREEIKGPKSDAPHQALEGFLRKTGVTREQLEDRGGVLFAVRDVPGQPAAAVLSEAVWALVHGFLWPKSMRWGEQSRTMTSLRWVRPLQGIVAIFGQDIVGVNIDGIESGATTLGHRFLASGPITIGGAHDYVETLRAAHVIVHFSERCALIRDGAKAAAEAAGLTLVEDEGLVAENVGLTEWPVPLLGRFDPTFLAVPEEVIQLTARINQKYFICHDRAGKLAPAFVCTANIDAKDGGAAIIAGNERVLAARLSDAKFFWEQDLKVPLEEQMKKLSQIVFHDKLGTVADKVERVAKLARWLVEEGIVACGESLQNSGLPEPVEGLPSSQSSQSEREGLRRAQPSRGLDRASLATLAERAAKLCKADLVTGMVGEFPELQGIIGGHLARTQGERPEVAEAIRDHYKPVGQGDEVPTDPVTVAVSLADKLDSLFWLWFAGEKPTGSKDPYAIRRAALAIIRILQSASVRLPVRSMMAATLASKATESGNPNEIYTRRTDDGSPVNMWRNMDEGGVFKFRHQSSQTRFTSEGTERIEVEKVSLSIDIQANLSEFRSFLADRLKVQQREAGVRHDLIDAVFALGGEDDLVRLLARVKALQAFVGTADGANLLAGYKRAANILKQTDGKQAAVIPAKAGIQDVEQLESRFRGNENILGAEAGFQYALDAAEPLAAAAIEREDFEAAMSALASLRAPIDAFFEGVMVNDPDPAVRSFRLGLLARFRDAVHRVADFSQIEG